MYTISSVKYNIFILLPMRETIETAPSDAPQTNIKPYSCGAQQIELTGERGKSIRVKNNPDICNQAYRYYKETSYTFFFVKVTKNFKTLLYINI